MNCKFVKGISICLAVILFTSVSFINVNATNTSVDTTKNTDLDFNNSSLNTVQTIENTYFEYKNSSAFEQYSGEDILLDNSSVNLELTNNAVLKEEYLDVKNVLYWEDSTGTATWEFGVPQNARYNFLISFRPLKTETNAKFCIKLDGEVPFDDLKEAELSSLWKNTDENVRKDSKGNEIAPEQILADGFFDTVISDKSGVELLPFEFNITAGKHTVSLEGLGYSVAISMLKLTAPENIVEYKEISKKYNFEKNEATNPIIIHAENADIKSDNTLIPTSVNGDSGMYPVNPYLTKINAIGGSNWSKPLQKLTWKFTVEKSGYYRFIARYKQNELVNGESYRWLKIDDKTPFEEAKKLNFSFGSGWQQYDFADNDFYYIWLDKGEHTLSLETTLGELSEMYDRLSDIVTKLGDLYLKIVMVTGEVPDVNRDYELFRQIPEFNDTLSDADKAFELLVKDMQNLSGKRGSQYIAAINNIRRVINKMLDAPYIAHIYVKDFYTNYTTVSSWLNEIKNMPLSLDEIVLIPYGTEYDWDEPNLFEKFVFSLKRFIFSFTNNYKHKGNISDKSIKIWINWGRDQTRALDSLIKDSFTPEKGITVDLQIVNNSLINGLLANDYPDLMLHLARTAPVDYGMRKALTDLTQFDDYEEVLTRFQKGADTPYWHNGALYAIPDQQIFYCMFYRSDILNELGLQVPTNWDEFLECATIIQRYNMSVYVPYTQITTTTTVNAGIGSLNLYPTLMLQNGLDLYNKERNSTAINKAEGIEVFDNWTKMYSDYGYLKEADFYNRFRNGSMPLGISPYTTYMTLYSAAPEIQGRWEIANVPATVGGNNYVSGSGTACGIVAKSDRQEEAWEFLKWWTSADTQVRYCNNVESILGMLGRIPTSNVKAMQRLSWDPKDLEKIMSQWECVREYPELPGGYYLTRAIDQAFWSVINDNINAKDAITKWAKVADNEIERKIKEYE